MDLVANYLVDMGLSRPSRYPYYQVETNTAFLFISYLAGFLGQIKEVGMTSGTDAYKYILSTPSRFSRRQWNKSIEVIRNEILENTLPVPSVNVKLYDILKFKSKYNNYLETCRIEVEKTIMKLLAITDPDVRMETKNIEIAKLKNLKKDIISIMEENHFLGILLSSLGAIGSTTIPSPEYSTNLPKIIGAAIGLAGIICASTRQYIKGKQIPNSPLAYAAFAERKLGRQIKRS